MNKTPKAKMPNPEEIKDMVAQQHGFRDWYDAVWKESISDDMVSDVSKLYASEVLDYAAEKTGDKSILNIKKELK